MPLLDVEEVSKSFGGLRALQRVTLSVEPGRIAGLIGPNGAGKTTLFNVISGYDPPDSGRVRFDGAPLVGLPPHQVCRRGVARTFQLVQPFARMSVLDNVAAGALFGRAGGARRSLNEARERALRLLPLGRLDGKAGVPAGSLTLSERKRLEMLRALATGPRLLLLDEVMAGLTPAEAAEIVAVVKRMRAEFDLTILLIEHNVRLVTALADQVTVLNHGRVIATGPPGEVVATPEVVKAYLGERWTAGPASRA